MTYSSVEIRNGYVGEESEDHIEKTSSENTIKHPDTVIRMAALTDDSSECYFHERSEVCKDGRSDVSIALKRHIPGIGPIIPEPQILAVVEYMQFWGAKQQGCVMPRNINHLLCPPLDLPPATNTTSIK